jgi:hypothetical protein
MDPKKKPTTQPKKENPQHHKLTDAVEDAMVDEDIPVETGVRPRGATRRDSE